MRWLLLDLETAGLKPEDGVVELGFLELDENAEVIDQYQTLVDPGTGHISHSAEGIHGISMDMVQDAPTLAEVFSEQVEGCYGKPLHGDPLVLVGHRISFDRSFLTGLLPENTIDLCTLRAARAIWPFAEDHKLSTLRVALGLRKDSGVAHRVMADVLVTHDLLKTIMATLNVNLRELTEWSQRPQVLRVVPFGKHKGEPFDQVPKSYLRWADNNLQDIDMDLAHTIKHYLAKR